MKEVLQTPGSFFAQKSSTSEFIRDYQEVKKERKEREYKERAERRAFEKEVTADLRERKGTKIHVV